MRRWHWYALGATALFVSSGLIFGPGPRNPRVDPSHNLEAKVYVPPEVRSILRGACYDCHSNETRWPWYSRLMPASLIMGRDVREGRKILNFSEWTAAPPKDAAKDKESPLAASCESVRSGHMPKREYRMMHPAARLSAGDVNRLCDWARHPLPVPESR